MRSIVEGPLHHPSGGPPPLQMQRRIYVATRAKTRPMRTALLPLALIATPASAQPPALAAGRMWHCSFTEQLRCDPGRACAPTDRNVRTFLDPLGGRYLTCTNGRDECIAQPARFSTWGTNLLVQVDGGTVVKLAETLEATGISTIDSMVFIERGRCTPAPAPTGHIYPLPPG